VVADDQAMVREGFSVLLGAQPDLEVVGEAVNTARVPSASQYQPDMPSPRGSGGRYARWPAPPNLPQDPAGSRRAGLREPRSAGGLASIAVPRRGRHHAVGVISVATGPANAASHACS
jgi:hypothetical protein